MANTNLWTLGGILAALWAFMLSSVKPDPSEGGNDAPPVPDNAGGDFREALRKVKERYGLPVAKLVEKIYRHETANMTSGQYKKTYTPGMKAFDSVFPFGWSLRSAGFTENDFGPLVTMSENSGGSFKWVNFKRLNDAVAFVGRYVDIYGALKWNGGVDPDYAAKLGRTPTPTADAL